MVIIADGNDFPCTVGFQHLALANGQAQMVTAVDVQQHAVFCECAVGLAGTSIIIQTVGRRFVLVGVGKVHVIFTPCYPTRFRDLALHGHTVDPSTVFRIRNKVEGSCTVPVIPDDFRIQFFIVVIILILIQLGLCAGRYSNRHRIADIQQDLYSINFYAGLQCHFLRSGFQIGICRSRRNGVLRTRYQQPTILTGNGRIFPVSKLIGAFCRVIIVIYRSYIRLTQRNCSIFLCSKCHTAPTLCANTDGIRIGRIFQGIGCHALRGFTGDGFDSLT